MKVGPLEFITPAGVSLPWFPMRAWAVTDPARNELDDYAISITEPPAGSASLPLHDLKRWLLEEKPKPRYWSVGASTGGDAKLTNARSIAPERATKLLAEQIFALGSGGQKGTDTYCLVPALELEKRKAYVNILQSAHPSGTLNVLFEPEMVLEYFRLVDGRLKLEQGKNSRVLVIDLGAGTTDFTIVTTRRDKIITEAKGRHARAERLQAIPGSATAFAGQWVDEQLAKQLNIELTAENRLEQLRQIEVAKVAVANGKGDQPLGGALLTSKDLTEVAKTLAVQLAEAIAPLRERLWASLTGSTEAQKLWEQERDELGVKSPADAFKLIDTLVFAGGTSLLPGLAEHLASLLNAERAQVLRVGSEFAVVAAVGALAHVLWSKHEPKRLELPKDTAEPAELDGGLSQSIEFLCSAMPAKGSPDRVIFHQGQILGPPPSVGETVLQEHQLILRSGKTATARFKPTEHPKGATPIKIRATKDNPTIRIVRNKDNQLRLRSDGLRDSDSVYLNLNEYGKKPGKLQRLVAEVPANNVRLQGTSDLIVDLGMSKTVLLRSETGLLSAEMISSACSPVSDLPGAVRSPPAELRPPEPQPLEPQAVGQMGRASDTPERPDSGENTAVAVNLGHESEQSNANEGDGAQPEPAEGPAQPHDPPAPPEGLSTTPAGPQSVADGPPEAPTELPPKPAESTTEAAGSPAGPSGAAPTIAEPSAADRTATVLAAQRDESAQPRAGLRWADRDPCDTFGEKLQAWLASESRIESVQWDVVMATIGLCIRDFVLIAGPPGCGKSSITRQLANGLGWARHRQFRDVAVQAHWVNSDPLVPLLGLKKQGQGGPPALPHDLLVLFDEFNITRPEYYLTELFHRTAEYNDPEHPAPQHSLRAFGTLNIDETSKPPSPKVLDRCFLIECGPRSWEEFKKAPKAAPSSIGSGVVHRVQLADLGDARAESIEIHETVASIVRAIEEAVTKHGLRGDLQPSLRVLNDLLQAEHLWRAAGLGNLLPEPQLHDRLIASRLLTKIQGPADQVRPVVDALVSVVEQHIKDGALPSAGQTHRRIQQFKVQLDFGFVSPWQ